ncbi:acyltransferase [Dyadobacter sp. CY347]|uniref:acyltransferase family protein n=1 Tax=Dyadobacter sp. CY347 TaxID=2909336 RepID=UPI001F25D858|nr:acyltransferase [Dyadobacter sp. CY347]MCF2487478.1 acyltransferase [Dyadobacter sp. CY347]
MIKERFAYIDALRGLAIAGVIVTHAASITHLTGILRPLTEMGGMGVQLFFVISAFTIFNSLSKHDTAPNAVRDFFIKRLFRIVPVYWLGIVLYTAVYGLQSRGWKEGPELWHYPFHLLLVNVLHPLTSSSVVPGGWSISCEVLFYAIVPLLYFRLKKTQNLVILMIASIVIYPIANKWLSIHLGPVIFPGLNPKDFWYRWLPSQLGCFTFGILLFKLIQANKLSKFLLNKRLNLFALASIFVSILLMLPYKLKIIEPHYIFSFLFMCMALLLSAIPWKFMVNNVFIFLGKISYSCYLIHFLVLKQVYDFASVYLPQIAQDNLVLFSFVLTVSVIFTVPLAMLSYQYVEQPAVNAGKNFMNYLNGTNSQSA